MLDALRFTVAAVAKKDYVQGLTHFEIKSGRITGYNGRMALSTAIDCDIDARPQAAKLLAAVRACGEDTISLNMTGAGRLAIRAGKFKAFVECIENDADFIAPAGDNVKVSENFMTGIKLLAPVMGIDASRAWAMGIKIASHSMFASNNVVVAQYWHGSILPFDIVIPANAVHELLRIGQPPTKIQVSKNTITFWFGEDRWLLSTLLEGSLWPLEKIEMVLDKPAKPVPLPQGFFSAIDTLKPFLDEVMHLYLTPQGLSTSLTEGDGASVDLALPVAGPQSYNHKQLTTLLTVATDVDWSSYPNPCLFTHRDHPIRGLIVGQRI